MENISYIMTAVLILTLLFPGHTHSVSSFKKNTGENNHGILGRVQMSGISSHVHCELLCLLTKNCSTFQIQEGDGYTEEADCILISSDENITADTTASHTDNDNDMSATCEASCLNGGTILNTTCKCQCQTTPNITRGPRCERVCHWELLEHEDTQDNLNIFRMHGTDPEMCKSTCLAHEKCFAITYNNNDHKCDLSKYDVTNPEVAHRIGKNNNTNSFALVCSENQTDN